MSDYAPSDESPRRPITERHARRSVAVVEPTTRQVRKTSGDTTGVNRPSVLPLKLTEALEKDPCFKVLSRDGRHWIEPIHGQAVPLNDETVERVAKHWLLDHLSEWRAAGCIDLHELIEHRWRFEVLCLLKSDKRRMTIFSRLPESDGQWLNPFIGVIEPSVTRDHGQITALTVKTMAAALARCPQANHGELLSREALRSIKIRLGYQDPETGIHRRDAE